MAPSLTTSSYLNPGYRVYSIDGDYSGSSYWVLDHRTVIMNLTATNQYNKTIMIDEYDARDVYQMDTLFPNDWNNLTQRLENDLDGPLMGLVYQYFTKSYANGNECDHSCRRGLLCSFKTARAKDTHACDSIPPFATIN
jgi:sphingomyelin phosphodiesterase